MFLPFLTEKAWCFPRILRFNIGPARENRDRVYVTDAKCPHQGYFDHLPSELSEKNVRKKVT